MTVFLPLNQRAGAEWGGVGGYAEPPASQTLNPTAADTDGDGMPNTWEDANLLDKTSPADARSDFDLDGLTALQEYELSLAHSGYGKPLGQWTMEAIPRPTGFTTATPSVPLIETAGNGTLVARVQGKLIGSTVTTSYPYTWSAATGWARVAEPTGFPPDTIASLTPLDVNSSGQVVGYFNSGGTKGFLYTPDAPGATSGQTTEFYLDSGDGQTAAIPKRISDAGYITGNVGNLNGRSFAATVNGREITFDDFANPTYHDVNSYGEFVGTAYNPFTFRNETFLACEGFPVYQTGIGPDALEDLSGVWGDIPDNDPDAITWVPDPTGYGQFRAGTAIDRRNQAIVNVHEGYGASFYWESNYSYYGGLNYWYSYPGFSQVFGAVNDWGEFAGLYSGSMSQVFIDSNGTQTYDPNNSSVSDNGIFFYEGSYHISKSRPSIYSVSNDPRVLIGTPFAIWSGSQVVPITSLIPAGNPTAFTSARLADNGQVVLQGSPATQIYILKPNQDTDGDGMPDDWEKHYGLNPNSGTDRNGDLDEDGINNLVEFRYRTNPAQVLIPGSGGQWIDIRPGIDTDGDGMPNVWEWKHGLAYDDASDAILDSDGDGLSNYQELRLGSDPNLADSDGDSLPDGWETDHNFNPNDNGSGNVDNGPDGDPDGDGLSNFDEYWFFTDPRLWDTDEDTLSDADEIFSYSTDPLRIDSDGDWMSDDYEIDEDFDPTDSADGMFDADSDTLPNRLEFVFMDQGYDPFVTNDASLFPWTEDPDQDDLTTRQEFDGPTPVVTGAMSFQAASTPASTHPRIADTDGDGMSDGWEVENGLDPTDDGSKNPDNGATGDPDGDGVNNATELANGSQPNNPDADGDGLTDAEEAALTTNPNNSNTDGDSLGDGEDADPKEILVNWQKASESSYILIDVDVPTGAGSVRDLNDQGEVLFDTGIWVGGEWLAKEAPLLSGSFPNGVETQEYDTNFDGWHSLSNDRSLLGWTRVKFTSGQAAGGDEIHTTGAWFTGQSPYHLAEAIPFNFDSVESMWPIGIDNTGRAFVRNEYRVQNASGVWEERTQVAVVSPGGGDATFLTPSSGNFVTGTFGNSDVSDAGAIVSNTTSSLNPGNTGAAATYQLAMWDSQLNQLSLPSEANGWYYNLHLSELPNAQTVLAGTKTGDGGGSVFLPQVPPSGSNSTPSAMQRVPSLSGKKIQMFAGDGTAMTTDGKLWRNGKLIPLRELCPKIGELLDAGCHLFPLKANKNGTYLIQAEGPNGEMEVKLASPIRIEGVDTTVNPANLQAPDRGVDNISIRAEKTPNNGNQPDMWIMAPIDRTNTVRFLSVASPSHQLHLSAENATFTPAVLNSPDQQVKVTGTGTATSESRLVVKIGGKEASCSIKVKAMKKRTVKVAVHAVGLDVTPPETPVVPPAVDIQNYLNSVFRPQINADISVVLAPADQPLGWDKGRASDFPLLKEKKGSEGVHQGNGTFDFTGGEELEIEDKYIDQSLHDDNANINVYILTRHFLGWEIREGEVKSSSGTVGITRRKPNVIVVDGKYYNKIVSVIAHEIGHCMIGYGHPDIDPFDIAAVVGWTTPNRGVAPHDGVEAEELKKRLMYSTVLPVSGKTMVKSEWDAAEEWLHRIIDNPQHQ